MKEQRCGLHPEELRLFHGTDESETALCICHQNFDPRMHGVHGTMFGKGAYVSATARYSHDYTNPNGEDGIRFMFCARVAVGNIVAGRPEYPRPPPLDPSKPHERLYDSCVDAVGCPQIFVIFDNDQCYPEYLIEYTGNETNIDSSNLNAVTSETRQMLMRQIVIVPTSIL